MTRIVFFNPRSNPGGKPYLPMSLLSLAALLEDKYDYALVDGNLLEDPFSELQRRFIRGAEVLAITVMPGRQVRQAIDVSRRIKSEFPAVQVVWGGYFPTIHPDVCIEAPYVDFLLRGHAEHAFLSLVESLLSGKADRNQAGLSWRDPASGTVQHNPEGPVPDVRVLPDYPYHRLDMETYMLETCLGTRTIPHHASYGCPFKCNFCGVVNMVDGRSSAQDGDRIERIMQTLVGKYGANAVQFFDNNFFLGESRTAEICRRLKPFGISWWAFARIDTLMNYRDETLQLMRESGLRMTYLGAEAGSDEILKRMNKGGRQTVDQALQIAARLQRFDIVPEFSFVIGNPPDPIADIDRTFRFIRRVKSVNPAAEIVLYLYSPVPSAGDLYMQAKLAGFEFPDRLETWAEDKWIAIAERTAAIDLPWLTPAVRRRIGNFQRVLHAAFPTTTDPQLVGVKRRLLRMAGLWRYKLGLYSAPLELVLLNRLMPHRRPEVAGF